MGGLAGVPGWISLDGDGWRCRSYLGDEWQAARFSVAGGAGPGWLPAKVPGSVVADLVRAGEIPDPYRDRNTRFAEWAAERWWAYQTDFEVPPPAPGERVELVLEGVDYAARVYLDGDLLGEHEGMFVPARYEVGERLRAAGTGEGGRHVLTVLIAPAPAEEPQSGDTARVRTHKSRMPYGWDFCPRLPHQGIWQPVGLRRTGPVRIERPFVRPVLAPDHRSARLDCQLELDSIAAGRARVRLEVGLDGRSVAQAERVVEVGAGQSAVQLEVELAEPALWWPNGYGEQPLYDVRLTVDFEGAESDRVELKTGLRSLRLATNEGAPADARPYRLVVNDVPVYINGWNWVPIDMLYGVPRPAKLAHLLRLARDAGVNLLRVWGGGLIESADFYSACDRMGILVWQEFIESSSGTRNAPSTEPEFVAMMARQADEIIPRRRNHPSLALWCGGNELMDDDGRPLDELAPVLGALRDVVGRLDPDRPFLPTSPSGPLANFTQASSERVGHDVHGPWEHQGVDRQQQLYEGGAALLHSEFGVEGMASLATIEATVSPALRWPPTRDNPTYAHRGAWWINEPLVQATFGGGIADLPTLIRASQFLQADGLRYAVEAHGRRRWLNSGVLPWQFNEPFPNAWCTSAVDYFGRPKPAYHAVAAAYEPVHVSAAFERQIWAGAEVFAASLWITSSLPEPSAGRLVARCVAADGAELERVECDVAVPPSSSTRVTQIAGLLSGISTDLFVLDIRLDGVGEGAPLSENRYLFSRTADLAPLRRLPPWQLEIDRVEEGPDRWDVRLRNSGEVLTPALRITDGRPVDAVGWATPDTDLLTLLPGEVRTVGVTFDGVALADRRITVSGWNVAERVVE